MSVSFFFLLTLVFFLPKTEKKKKDVEKKPFENSRLKTKRVHGSGKRRKEKGKENGGFQISCCSSEKENEYSSQERKRK